MPIVSPVPASVVSQLVPSLQATMVELIDLAAIGKQLHWCVQGGIPFLPVHEALDGLVSFALDSRDTVAERIVQMGMFPDGRTSTVALRSPLPQPDLAAVCSDDVPGVVAPTLIAMALRLHQRTLDAASDPVTQNIFIDVGQQLQKLSWFWQASQDTC